MMLHTETSTTGGGVRLVPTKQPLKWGIASACRISHDFVTALRTLPAGEHTVVCVAARQQLDADRFASLHHIPTALEGYDALATHADVEVVYIGAATPEHFPIVSLMLTAGKHVLCEKPLCMRADEVRLLTALAKAQNRFLMEGIWSRFFPSYQFVKRQIDGHKLGDIEEITVQYGLDLAMFIRNDMTVGETRSALTMDAVQLFQWIFRQYPVAIQALGGEDMSATLLLYPDGGRAKISFTEKQENTAMIRGSSGSIVVCIATVFFSG